MTALHDQSAVRAEQEHACCTMPKTLPMHTGARHHSRSLPVGIESLKGFVLHRLTLQISFARHSEVSKNDALVLNGLLPLNTESHRLEKRPSRQANAGLEPFRAVRRCPGACCVE